VYAPLILLIFAAAAQIPPEPEGNRQRWQRLTPEARDRLREIYQRLEKLPPSERKLLLERLRQMAPQDRKRAVEAARDRVRRRADERPARPALKKKDIAASRDAKALGEPKAARPALLRPPAAVSPEVRRRLDRLAENLPPPLRERVKRFTRREQLEFFRAYRESEIILRTFRQPGEEQALQTLPADRLRGLLSPEATRPDSISEESWGRWRRLRPAERQQALRRLKLLREEPRDARDEFRDGRPTGQP